VSGGEVPAGAFLGKSIPEAAKLYLAIVKRKQTSREIADALKKGGIESTARNFYPIVHSILDRARKAGSGIVKLDRSYWGLADWYPAGLRSSVAVAEKPPRKQRRGRPRKSESKTKTTEGPKPKDRILQVLHNQPGIEMSMQELADHLKMKPRAVNMVLINLTKSDGSKDGGRKISGGSLRPFLVSFGPPCFRCAKCDFAATLRRNVGFPSLAAHFAAFLAHL
jgi:hypothetical protein